MDISWNIHGATRHSREILAMPVYSIVEGKPLGSIDALYVRDEDHRVPLVRVGKPSSDWHGFVPFSAFRKIGPRVALVDTEDVLHEQVAASELDGLETGFPGRLVITQSGKDVGRLVGVSVEEGTGKIDHLRVETDAKFYSHLTSTGDNCLHIPEDMIVSLKNGAVFVRDEIQHRMEK